MSVYVQQPGGNKRQEARKSMISKLEKALKDTKTTFEAREKLYKETGQDIDQWTKGLLAQKVEFGAFMTSVKSLIEDKRDYTFDQWITLFCVKSRSDIYFCLRLFKNRKLLKREFGDNLEASVAEAIVTMNKMRKKYKAKTSIFTKRCKRQKNEPTSAKKAIDTETNFCCCIKHTSIYTISAILSNLNFVQ